MSEIRWNYFKEIATEQGRGHRTRAPLSFIPAVHINKENFYFNRAAGRLLGDCALFIGIQKLEDSIVVHFKRTSPETKNAYKVINFNEHGSKRVYIAFLKEILGIKDTSVSSEQNKTELIQDPKDYNYFTARFKIK